MRERGPTARHHHDELRVVHEVEDSISNLMARREAEFKEEQENGNEEALEPPIDTQSAYQRGLDE